MSIASDHSPARLVYVAYAPKIMRATPRVALASTALPPLYVVDPHAYAQPRAARHVLVKTANLGNFLPAKRRESGVFSFLLLGVGSLAKCCGKKTHA